MKNNNSSSFGSLIPRGNSPYNIPNLFQDFFGDVLGQSNNLFTNTNNEFVPSLDVSETDASYKVVAELPGMEEKDFEVTMEDNLLRIKGEKKAEKETKEERYHRFESSYGSFERILRLPEAINSDAYKAQFKNGVLTLEIPKDKAASRVKKLKISS